MNEFYKYQWRREGDLMKRHFFRIAAAIVLCMSLSFVFAYADDNEIYDAGKYKKITQSYKEFNGKENVEFSYSDEMLLTDATELSGDLAKLSANLALLAYSNVQIEKIKASSMGYDFTLYNYDVESTYDNNDMVAFSIGHKSFTKDGTTYNAYIVPIRGTQSREWYSNFRIGNRDDGYHEGFKLAADGVLAKINEKVNTTNNIFLITGHSRGAAVANIVAAELTKSGSLASQNRIFGYTFACPAVKENISENYANIRNFNNPGDGIVALPLEDWGFARYGEDISLPVNGVVFSAFKQRYFEINGKEYDGALNTNAQVEAIKAQLPTKASCSEGDNAFLLDVGACVLAEKTSKDLSTILASHGKGLWDITNLNQDIIDAFQDSGTKNAHKPTTYVLWINSLYYGYKGWYGLSGAANTELTLDNTSVIDSLCFGGCTRIKTVAIPKSVVQISEKAFKGASGLTQISFGGIDTEIYNSAETIEASVNFVAHTKSKAANYAELYSRGRTNLCDSFWDGGTETKPATCLEGGEKTHSCTVCNAIKTEPTEKDENAHEYGEWISVGEHQHKRVCKHDSNHEELAEHEWVLDDNAVSTPATCSAEGEEHYVCKDCKATKTETTVIDEDAHEYGDWVNANENQHKRVCKHDGSHEEFADHEWVLLNTPVPTCAVTYYEDYKCTVCGATKTIMREPKLPTCIYRTPVVVGEIYVVDDCHYQVIILAKNQEPGEVKLIKSKNAKNVKIPDTIKLADENTYRVISIGPNAFSEKKIKKVTLGANVEKIENNAFKGSNVKKIVLKTMNLTKKNVKGSLKGAKKLKTIQVKIGRRKINQKFVKKYQKFFTPANAGKKVTVK